MSTEEHLLWLEAMLDRAIASYEAHRKSLQRVSAFLCRSEVDSSYPMYLTSEERKKVVADIDDVLQRDALRFAPIPSSAASRNTSSFEPYLAGYKGAPVNQSNPYASRIIPNMYERREVPRQEDPPPRSSFYTAAAPVRSNPGTSRLEDTSISKLEGDQTIRKRKSGASPTRPDRETPPTAVICSTSDERQRPSEEGRPSKTGIPLSPWPVPDETNRRQMSPSLAEQYRSRFSQSPRAPKQYRDPEPMGEVQPLRTVPMRRGAEKCTDSSEIEARLLPCEMKDRYENPKVVSNSPAAENYMKRENEDLRRKKEASERELRNMAPLNRSSMSPMQPETSIENQLKREQLVLEKHMQRMIMERDALLIRNPTDSGSEPKYAQLNHRIGTVSEDLKRVDRELETVRKIENREAQRNRNRN